MLSTNRSDNDSRRGASGALKRARLLEQTHGLAGGKRIAPQRHFSIRESQFTRPRWP